MTEHILVMERLTRALDRNSALLERTLRAAADEVQCPECGSADVQNTSTMGNPRLTCCGCGGSWTPKLEAVEVENARA